MLISKFFKHGLWRLENPVILRKDILEIIIIIRNNYYVPVLNIIIMYEYKNNDYVRVLKIIIMYQY